MIVRINDVLKAIAYTLLVLFFVIGVMKTCGSFTELKRPDQRIFLIFRISPKISLTAIQNRLISNF